MKENQQSASVQIIQQAHREQDRENRKVVTLTVLIWGGILFFFILMVLGRFFAPGLMGTWMSLVAGFMSTPFVMEAGFLLTGFIIVAGLNAYRLQKEGDEFVEIADDEEV